MLGLQVTQLTVQWWWLNGRDCTSGRRHEQQRVSTAGGTVGAVWMGE